MQRNLYKRDTGTLQSINVYKKEETSFFEFSRQRQQEFILFRSSDVIPKIDTFCKVGVYTKNNNKQVSLSIQSKNNRLLLSVTHQSKFF